MIKTGEIFTLLDHPDFEGSLRIVDSEGNKFYIYKGFFELVES